MKSSDKIKSSLNRTLGLPAGASPLDEPVIKKCKLCNGYFRVKYTSSQECCTRICRETSTTCNEYASRKSYNRLYARIRRGRLPADTPLMDQLKALHDECTEKYENTHQKDREAVWKETIVKNKELLNLRIFVVILLSQLTNFIKH